MINNQVKLKPGTTIMRSMPKKRKFCDMKGKQLIKKSQFIFILSIFFAISPVHGQEAASKSEAKPVLNSAQEAQDQETENNLGNVESEKPDNISQNKLKSPSAGHDSKNDTEHNKNGTELNQVSMRVSRIESQIESTISSMRELEKAHALLKEDHSRLKKDYSNLQKQFSNLQEDIAATPPKTKALTADFDDPLLSSEQLVILSQLLELASRGATYENILNEARSHFPTDQSLVALEEFAGTGAPTITQLTSEFLQNEDEFAKAIAIHQSKNENKGWVDRKLSQIVVVKKKAPTGDDDYSQLAKTRIALNNQDLGRAIDSISRLSQDSREIIVAPWLSRAKSRHAIDNHIALLRKKILDGTLSPPKIIENQSQSPSPLPSNKK